MLEIIDWKSVGEKERTALLQRPIAKKPEISAQVETIISQVRERGDAALFDFTRQYDNAQLNTLKVADFEIQAAKTAVKPELLDSIYAAVKRVTHYQQQCLPKTLTVDTQDGIVCQRIPSAIETVGLYVPGGSAPLISTLIMLAIPAKIAGCRKRILCTPPNAQGKIHPALLATAALCEIDTIYKLGGAQAIAAMAYGTESVPKVAKLFGPGNAWVTAAKQQVACDSEGASIDMPAGPSEVLIIADENANPAFIAADLLSQLEHGVDSQAILLTDSKKIAQASAATLKKQAFSLSRKAIIDHSLKHSRIILLETLTEALDLSNRYAPEHLILQVTNPDSYLSAVKNAGAVFVGSWTPETMGDYLNGANHVLPTEGYANRLSGLSVSDFMKYISVQRVTDKGLQVLGETAMMLAEAEGLTAHKEAVNIRLKALRELR